ncbi:unnamed protein product [Malus baccata var. baccata]
MEKEKAVSVNVRAEMEKLSPEQLKAVKEQTDLEVNLLQDSLNNIRTATARLEIATSALHDLSLRPQGKKMLVPLTASLYVPGTLHDAHQVLVDVGTGYFIEKTMPQAKDYCERKISLLKSNFDQLVEVASKKKSIADEAGAVLQAKDMSLLKHIWRDVERLFLASTAYNGFSVPCLTTVNQSQKSIHTIVANMAQLFSYTACRQLSQMFLAVIFFHGSEYILAVGVHGKSNVTLKSLLISKNYLLAMVFSLVEYCVEIILFPGLKEHWWVSNLGLAMVIIGEIIRKMAIITAGKSFTHLIRTHASEHHRLITNGVYRVVRHPGYCGFFIWSVGTQIMLCNPVSTIAFALVVWRFFAQRIPYEEYFLRQFFGPQYEEYGRRIPSGVPFVK